MDRASVFGTEGWGFESLRVHFANSCGRTSMPPGLPLRSKITSRSRPSFGRHSRWQSPIDRHELFSDAAAGLIVKRRKPLDHAVPFGHLENASMPFSIVLQPGASVFENRTFAEVEHAQIVAQIARWARRIPIIFRGSSALGRVWLSSTRIRLWSTECPHGVRCFAGAGHLN
jgi:hypothetical protein